ncbi:Hypothetical predicted protein [Mytilus galloprovincialis]|nr:Hypothetical predicted protein [Mytilus galloprovincialis]
MDDLSVEEFLMQIGSGFTEFASVFRSNGFDTIGSLRCIDVDEDLNQMFQQANIQLLLGRRRQLQNALKNLKDISPNNSQMGLQKPSLNNIV